MMIKRIFSIALIPIFAGYTLVSQAQMVAGQERSSPDSNAEVEKLAKEITAKADDDNDKAYAIYEWVACNITYDFMGVENVTMGFESTQVVKEALDTGKGVCQHYAELFHALAIASDLESLVVSGYTRQNGKIDKVPHAWNALKINSTWYLFDPTWGSGYFDGSAYQQEFRDNYFMVKPIEMIKSHMPFDPLFQFLPHPVSHLNFEKGKNIPGDQAFEVNTDTEDYLTLSEDQQIKESMDRVKSFGIANTMVRGYYSNLNRRYKVFVANQQVELHNRAIEKFNKVVEGYNSYATEMNARGGRLPKNTRPIKNQLETLEEKAYEVQKLFEAIDAPARLALTLSENKKNLEMLLNQIQKDIARLNNK